ncbi:MAG TPA: glycosyltransferase [Glutamicibacter sp.]|nr:glycosyltransferase [Glutamicibacter sp.]
MLVIAHRRAGHLQRLLDGVQASSWRPQEVVVVYMDDPQTDPVSCQVPLQIIHLQSAPEDRGLQLARARNTAAHHARSEHLVFLDVDCIPSNPAFSLLLRGLKDHAGLVMASPRYLRAALEEGPTPGDQALLELSVAHHLRQTLAQNEPSGRYEMFWSLGFAIRAADFQRIGGFSTAYTGYGAEDTDFAFTAREHGLPMVFSDATVFHQHHGVCKPPLNHFAAIVENARIFRARWGVWPMEGWLNAFTQRGLIDFDPGFPTLQVIREPTASEVREAYSAGAY